jgi:predicted methyltransferase MtxX (methanogen marker protein 4)
LVTRTEKWSEEISNWRKEFELIDAKRLDKVQVERMKAAMAAVRGQLDELEGKLG